MRKAWLKRCEALLRSKMMAAWLWPRQQGSGRVAGLIAALIRSGAMVTVSWPIQTEMVNKVTQKRENLSTSV
jgi:adenine-specific DNA methylase